jgi:hypothetical protein
MMNMVTSVQLHDDVALALAFYPLPVFIGGILAFEMPSLSVMLTAVSGISALTALFMAGRHWNDPTSVVRRGKYRLVLAVTIAVPQVAAWLGIMLYMLFGR